MSLPRQRERRHQYGRQPDWNGGVFVRTYGPNVSDVTIATGEITAANPTDYAIYADIAANSGARARNLSVTTNGNVVGYIYMQTEGTGTVDLTTNAGVTGDIYVEASNQASTGAFTVNLNQDVGGNVWLHNYGTGTATVRTRNIAGTFAPQSTAANNSVVVDGTITMGTVVEPSSATAALAGVYLHRRRDQHRDLQRRHFRHLRRLRLSASAIWTVLSSACRPVWEAHPATVRRRSTPTDRSRLPVSPSRRRRECDGRVGISNFNSAVPVDVNLHGAVSATSISDTASTVIGISATQSGLGTLRLTADGTVTATANAAGSTAPGSGRRYGILGFQTRTPTSSAPTAM